MREIEIIQKLKQYRLPLEDEKILQARIGKILAPLPKEVDTGEGKIDFLTDCGIGIEVKLKGSAKDILRQCKRYCKSDEIRSLILVTNRFMGFPEYINGKPCYLVSLGEAWL